MKKTRKVVSVWLCVLVAVALSTFAASAARAQNSPADEQSVTPTAVDEQAAQEANLVYRHARPANTLAGKMLRNKEIAEASELSSTGAPKPTSTATTTTTDNDGLRHPADLSYQPHVIPGIPGAGAVVSSAESHAIYLLPNGKCPISSCWGNPEGFLADLAGSDFIHLLDQYIGLASSNRYTVGSHKFISYKPTPKTAPLTDAKIQAYVHAVAAASHQTGYKHIYDVFLPPGQDECFTATDGVCYSPDVPGTFAFCGYHGSVDFTDIGHVLYTVEPFNDVPGCSVRPGTPNGQLVDSTNNTLSHETFETITDPDGSAWYNFTSVALNGAEIGDECSFFVILPPTPAGSPYFNPSVFIIGAHRYGVQPEYSNSEHACAVSP